MRNGNNFNKGQKKPKILITPLDWGLGHATRCIPIINEFIYLNCEVLIAASGGGYFLLKKEFPALEIFRVPGYKIKYSRDKKWLPIKLLIQIPQLFFLIYKEHFWLKKAIRKYEIDAVISDNRFGMFTKNIPCIYITHQLLIKTGNTFTENSLQKVHYYFIKKFNKCWVPDYESNGLAGELSHQENKPGNVLYIGPLSRLAVLENLPVIYDIMISISGPEPQRSIFEKIILAQIKFTKKKILIVRGLPDINENLIHENTFVKILNHLSSFELNKGFQQSNLIISRSGYTTIMDLIKIGKSAVLVPTPGQTEQEYLAHHLMKNEIFYSVDQDKFYLEPAVKAAVSFHFNALPSSMNSYKKIIGEFVMAIKGNDL